jgi:hypothetical protein
MVQLPPKKGPRMTVTSQRTSNNQDLGRDPEIDAFIRKVGSVIEDARSKMSDEDREEADRKAKAILEGSSTVAASASRRSA